MSPNSLPAPRVRPVDLLARRRSRLTRARVRLPDGLRTTLHVASYDRRVVRPRVVVLTEPAPLVRWCRLNGVRDAVVGGFFLRSPGVPLGHVWVGGAVRPSRAFDAPWGAVRACVHARPHGLAIAQRDQLAANPTGDLLQAGPLLVSRGRMAYADGEDREGFSAGAHQFDSDITTGRYPRAALGIAGDRVLAVACDGRARDDAGMTLGELAGALVALGATDALNLDGGGSASLVHAGRLRNRPREQHGAALLEGRPIVTAIVFDPR
ncbi:MAG: phosphodiester glycosidase family protein [Solirubrobacteraceae bacterium]